MNDNINYPVGYKVQTGIPCCANCKFGGYLGSLTESICICEIMGIPDDGCYDHILRDPLGICDAWKCNN